MKIVCLSDTHGLHRRIKNVTDADIIIHAGDISNYGEEHQVEDFLKNFPKRFEEFDSLLARKEKEFSDALVKSHGVIVDALSSTEIVTPGEAVEIAAQVYIATDVKAATPSAKLAVPEDWKTENMKPEPIVNNGGMSFMRGREIPSFIARFKTTAPSNAPSTQPYWLAKPRTKDQFDWDDKMPRNLPFQPALAQAQVDLMLSGERVTILTTPAEAPSP